jgi:hypothetical protein
MPGFKGAPPSHVDWSLGGDSSRLILLMVRMWKCVCMSVHVCTCGVEYGRSRGRTADGGIVRAGAPLPAVVNSVNK